MLLIIMGGAILAGVIILSLRIKALNSAIEKNSNSLQQLEKLVYELIDPRDRNTYTHEKTGPGLVTVSKAIQTEDNPIVKKEFRGDIIVIEENPEIQAIIREYLSTKSYNVILCPAVAEGIQKIIEIKPVAVVLNMAYKDVESWKALAELKKGGSTAHIPVIPVTFLKELNLGFGLDIYDLIIKPFGLEKIKNICDRLDKNLPDKVRNILVIDADKDIDYLPLKDNGYEITQYGEAGPAIKYAVKAKPDLIAVNMSMPKTDGITIAYRLQISIETKGIPVVLIMNEDVTEKAFYHFNNSMEKAALRARRHPIDMLKVIRDRLKYQEEGLNDDISGVWLDIKDEIEIENIPRNKVLVADDDPDTLFTIGELVRSTGCEPIMVKDGAECLQVLKDTKIDLLLLDIMMPQMDGFETIRKIRAHKKYSDLPVIALTSAAMNEENEIVIKHGFSDYISKPINPELLSFKIEQMITAAVDV